MLRAWRLAVFGAAIAAAMMPAHSPAQTKAHYVLGKPYQFDGVWYEPAVDYGYDQTGIAAIYPPDRAGLSTTSGEPYDGNAITGAHKTLPLPCVVRVTNLENGKSIKVRLNDRGPFVDNRLVELTPAAAKALGVTNQTGVQVRVQIMAKESQALADTLQPAGGAVAGATPAPAPVVKVTALPLASSTTMQPMKPVSAPGATPPLPPQPTSPPADTTTVPNTTQANTTPANTTPANTTPANTTSVITPAPSAPATATAIQLAIPLPQPTQTPATPNPPPTSTPPASASVAAPVPTPSSTPAAEAPQVHIVVPDVAPAAAPTPPPAVVASPAIAPASAAAAAEPTPVVIPSPTPADPGSAAVVAPPVLTPPPAPAAATAAPAQTAPAVSASVTNATEPAAPATATPAPAQAIPVQVSSAPVTPEPSKIKPLPVDLPAQFFIQTGAFKNTADANTLRDKLTALAPAKVVPTRLGADDFNAVLLGPIPNMNDAQRLLKQVTGMGYSDAVLIIE